jgi:hypothetical protein
MNPKVWIGDTGASVHITPHRNGMNDVKKAKDVDAITMGNGKSEDAVVIGNIDGRLRDKNGNVLNDAKISDVTHLPKGKYNLFKITKLQNDGWILGAVCALADVLTLDVNSITSLVVKLNQVNTDIIA